MSARSTVARWHVGQLSMVIGTAIVVIVLSMWAGTEKWKAAEWDRQLAYLPIPYAAPPPGLSPESLAVYNLRERVTRAKREAERDSKIPAAEATARVKRRRVVIICFLIIPLLAFVPTAWAAWTWFGTRSKQ